MIAPPASATQRVLQAGAALAVFTAMHVGWLRSEFALLVYAAMALAWPPAVAWTPLPARAVLRAYVPFALAWTLLLVVYLRVMHALGATVEPQPTLQRIAEGGMGGGLGGAAAAGLVLGIVVIAPVYEEHVFRGYLWSGLRTRLPAWATNAICAAAFGAFHGWPYALPVAVLGLFFGAMRARHDALLPAAYAHAIHNGVTVAVTSAWPGHLELLYPR